MWKFSSHIWTKVKPVYIFETLGRLDIVRNIIKPAISVNKLDKLSGKFLFGEEK